MSVELPYAKSPMSRCAQRSFASNDDNQRVVSPDSCNAFAENFTNMARKGINEMTKK